MICQHEIYFIQEHSLKFCFIHLQFDLKIISSMQLSSNFLEQKSTKCHSLIQLLTPIYCVEFQVVTMLAS
jgi:hypothetical protein